MKFEIKHRLSGDVLFSLETDSIKLCVEAAIKSKINLSSADLRSANLSSADLRYANLSSADLSSANLSYANLSSANLSSADLRYADLSSANLSSANLRYANLSSANLSSAENILSATEYIRQNFKKTKAGIIVYKTLGSQFPPNNKWTIKAKSIIEEVVNPDRTVDCACGINVATLEWVKSNTSETDIWQCLIKWEWLAGVVVPYHTDGKIRAEKVQLIKTVKR
jgi:uncharacterized protein YjbI with pentapeptide repeats